MSSTLQLTKKPTKKRAATEVVSDQDRRKSDASVPWWKRLKQSTQASGNVKDDNADLTSTAPAAATTTFTFASQMAQDDIRESGSYGHTRAKGREQGLYRSSQSLGSRTDTSMDERDAIVIQLSSRRRVSVRKWKSSILIDLREFYDDHGTMKPGKKGISLTKDQWLTLVGLASAINEAVSLVEEDSVDSSSLSTVQGWLSSSPSERTIQFSLSAKRRVSVRKFGKAVLVDVREYYEDHEGAIKPGKKGIALSTQQWTDLCKLDGEISDAIKNV